MENVIDTVKESEGRYRIVLNPQFDMEVDEGEYYAVRRKPTYPKTYKECCEVLMGKTDFQDFELVLTKLSTNQAQNSITTFSSYPSPHITTINNFYKLLICRDTYWLLAGKQIGLGEPWEPDWTNGSQQKKYCLYKDCFNIKRVFFSLLIAFLLFPPKKCLMLSMRILKN